MDKLRIHIVIAKKNYINWNNSN